MNAGLTKNQKCAARGPWAAAIGRRSQSIAAQANLHPRIHPWSTQGTCGARGRAASVALGIHYVTGLVLLAAVLVSGHLWGASPQGDDHRNLPAAAQAVVSATLGRDDARYQVRAQGSALAAESPAQSLKAEFSRQGVEVRAGSARWRLALAGYGYGDQLEALPEAAPQRSGNRVEYRRGTLVEWYVNGPMGLEQGFTLAEPPEGRGGKNQGRPLTIALALGGNLKASPEAGAGAKSVTLSDSQGQAVLRYSGLTAHDATGRELRAWLEVGGEKLQLRVDEHRGALSGNRGSVGPASQADCLRGGELPGARLVRGHERRWQHDRGRRADATYNSDRAAVYVFVKPAGGWATAPPRPPS